MSFGYCYQTRQTELTEVILEETIKRVKKSNACCYSL